MRGSLRRYGLVLGRQLHRPGGHRRTNQRWRPSDAHRRRFAVRPRGGGSCSFLWCPGRGNRRLLGARKRGCPRLGDPRRRRRADAGGSPRDGHRRPCRKRTLVRPGPQRSRTVLGDERLRPGLSGRVGPPRDTGDPWRGAPRHRWRRRVDLRSGVPGVGPVLGASLGRSRYAGSGGRARGMASGRSRRKVREAVRRTEAGVRDHGTGRTPVLGERRSVRGPGSEPEHRRIPCTPVGQVFLFESRHSRVGRETSWGWFRASFPGHRPTFERGPRALPSPSFLLEFGRLRPASMPVSSLHLLQEPSAGSSRTPSIGHVVVGITSSACPVHED